MSKRRMRLWALFTGVMIACAAPAPEAQAQDKARAVEPQVLIKNVRVWDGKADSVSAATNVLVTGNKISKIGNGASAGPGATIIDGGGRTLMPGLIDMHSHLAIQEGMLTGRNNYDQMAMGARAGKDMLGYLDQGFTTARDAGGNVLGLAKAVNNG